LKDNLDDFDKSQNTPTVRQRKAAYKAWKTIRKKKREIVGKDTQKIDPFLTVDRLASLVHPETEGRGPTETKNASYGRGIIGLFHKTPPRYWMWRILGSKMGVWLPIGLFVLLS
jgi:hypothetical protein